jgi:hypothetical protein
MLRQPNRIGPNRLLWLALAGALLVAGLTVAPGAASTEARLTVVSSSNQGVELVLDTPLAAVGRRLADGHARATVRGEGFAATTEGVLPARGVLVGVPAGVEVRLEAAGAGDTPVAWLADALPDSGSPPADGAVTPASGFAGAAPAELTNEVWLRDLRVVRLVLRPLSPTRDGRGVVLHRRITAHLRFVGTPALGRERPDPLWDPGLAVLIANWSTAQHWRVAGGNTVLGEPNPLAASGAWKVSVDRAGLQTVTAGTMVLSGLPPGSDPRHLRLFDNNVEIPLKITGGEDGRFDGQDNLAFYGRPVDTRYAGTNIYWLTVDAGGTGARMAGQAGKPGEGKRPEAFTDTLHIESERLYDPHTPESPGDDRFYWRQLVASSTSPLSATHTITFSLPGLKDGPAQLRLRLKGDTIGSHVAKLTLNDVQFPDWTWDGAKPLLIHVPLADTALLTADKNRLVVEAPGPGANSYFVDWLEVDYPRDFDARGTILEFLYERDAPCQVTGLPDKAVEVYDVTTPDVPTYLEEVVVAGSGPYVANFQGKKGHRYLALAASGRRSPPLAMDTPNDLVTSRAGADVLIVTHDSFRIPAIWLRGKRATDGFRARLVDVQDIYDTYSDGEPDPTAIRDFVAGAFARWQGPPPAYLVLIGDGHYDYRHYLSTTPWYIPPYMIELGPDSGETPSDNAFATVSGDDILPDLAVGRLAVNSLDEATQAVERLRNYEQTTPDLWRRKGLLVADDGPPDAPRGESFAELMAAVAASLPHGISAPQITLGDGTTPTAEAVRSVIATALNEGRVVLGYLGEGRLTQWAAEGIWRQADVDALTNQVLPIVLELTAGTGYFVDPQRRCLAESFTDRATGGAIADWSATGNLVGAGHEILGQAWFQAVYGDRMRAGAAAAAAKAALFAVAPEKAELIQTLTWFGDPALVVAGTIPRDPASPTPMPTPTVTSTPRPSGTATASPSITPTPTNTLLPSLTPAVTDTATATDPPPTSTPSLTPTPTSSPVPTDTPTVPPTATATSRSHGGLILYLPVAYRPPVK